MHHNMQKSRMPNKVVVKPTPLPPINVPLTPAQQAAARERAREQAAKRNGR